MQKTKIRKSVSVEDEIDNPLAEASWRDEPERVNRPKYVSGLGAWWELLALAIGGAGLASLILHRNLGWNEPDFLVALGIILGAIAVSIVVGRYEGVESSGRKTFGFLFISVSGALMALSFVLRFATWFSWIVAVGIVFLLIGWSLRRLRGESVPRSLSLGLASIVPWITVTGGLLTIDSLDVVREWTNQLSFWFAGIMADLAGMSFTPLESGIEFPDGAITSGAAFQNFAGVIVAIAVSLATSLISRQSFIVSLICVCISFMWWMVMRGWTCVAMASQADFDSQMLYQGMPILYLVGMVALIVGTNLGLGSLIAPIPVELHQYEVSSMTVIYNAIVSFPQLGPASVGMLPDDLRQSAIEKSGEETEDELKPEEVS